MVEMVILMKKILQFLLLSFLLLSLVYGTKVIEASRQSLTIWFEQLVPSMFVSMVLIRVLYKQDMLTHLFPSLFCRWFAMDSHAMTLVLSSMLLGFPNGSIFIEEAYQKGNIDLTGARRLFPICCFPTPGFVILSCGAGLFHSITIGLLFYLSQILYGFLCLWLTRRTPISFHSSSQHATSSLMKDLAISMMESGTSLFMIGGYLMLFMSMTSVLFSFLPAFLRIPLSICTEFSNGIYIIQEMAWPLVPSLMASCALLGFGGFCVHMQIYSLCDQSKTSYLRFFLYRIFQSILTTVIFCLFYHFLV